MNTFFNLASLKEPAKLSVSDFDQPNIFDPDIFQMSDNESVRSNANVVFINNNVEGLFSQTFGYEDVLEHSDSINGLIPFFEPKFDEVLPPIALPRKKDISWNTKKKKIKKASDYKNHARNLVNIIINSLEIFRFKMEEICSNLDIDASEIISFFIRTQNDFTSVNAVKDSWTISLSDSDFNLKSKIAFKRFCHWFIRKKMTRYIIKEGKMKEKRDYLKYKTRILMKAVKNPEVYNCNYYSLMKD